MYHLLAKSLKKPTIWERTIHGQVNNGCTPAEIGRIYKGMCEHSERDTIWGMSIGIRRDSEKVMHSKTPTREELLEGEKGIPLGSTKRGGIPHLPPHFEWPFDYVFGAIQMQIRCVCGPSYFL